MYIDMMEYNWDERCRAREYLTIKRNKRFAITITYILMMMVIICLFKAAGDWKMLIWEAGTGEVTIDGELIIWVKAQFWNTFLDTKLIIIAACNIALCTIITVTYYKIPSYGFYKQYLKWAGMISVIILVELITLCHGIKMDTAKVLVIIAKIAPVFSTMRLLLPLDSRPQENPEKNILFRIISNLGDFISKCLIDRL